jgi:hypothetical protein
VENSLQAIREIEGFGDLKGTTQVDAIVFACLEFESSVGVKPAQVREVYDALNLVAYSRIAQYLSEASKVGRGKKPRFLKSSEGYRLEAGARADASKLFPGRATKKAVQKHLEDHLSKMPSLEARNYLAEALGCFTHDYYRAAIVMTWCLAYDLLRSFVFTKHVALVNKRLSGRKVPQTITTLEDFEAIGERDLIDTAKAAGVFGKEFHKTLVQLLDDRNSYAHPSGKPITASIAEAYIEKAVLQMISKLK